MKQLLLKCLYMLADTCTVHVSKSEFNQTNKCVSLSIKILFNWELKLPTLC